jgi:hypothetical protein
MTRATETQLANALEAIHNITYFADSECISLLECLLQKTKGTYADGAWSETAKSVLGDLISDLKYDQRQAQIAQREELPIIGATIGRDDQPSWMQAFNDLSIMRSI